ncbi:MAG: c-type cytochrome [Akkermansiaceae bacterium]
MKYYKIIITLLLSCAISHGQEKHTHNDGAKSIATVTYDVHPSGTVEKPLILRTYVPDPGLEDAVLGNHGKGAPASKYSPGAGKDVKGDRQPIDGIPAAIAVNHAKELSYVWDTTECRLLYAWKDGFLDMTPYWGAGDRGNRKGFGYVPKLDGVLTYMTKGYHPIHINGKPVGIPKYLGHSRKNNLPTFRWSANNSVISTVITPISKSDGGSLRVEYRAEGDTKLSYHGPGDQEQLAPNHLVVTIQPDPAVAQFSKKKEKEFKGVTVERGEHLFTAYSCATCHSVDGGKNHGPTMLGLFGSKRAFGDEEVIADDAYLYESIINPNAKIAPGYQANFMPKFPMSKDEINSLVLYIKSIKKIHD